MTRQLSPRELQILALRNKFMKGREIAEELGISPNTVKRHIQSIRCTFKPRSLSPAEKIVAKLICAGLNNKEIAIELNKTIKTIEAQRLTLYRKLQVHNVAQLINRLTEKAMKAHA